MTTLAEYGQRAEKFALQSSTILGIAGVVTAATGSGVDAVTGQPWVAAAVGLGVGALAAIFLPQKDPAPIIQGAEDLTQALQRHEAAVTKAKEVSEAAALTLAHTAPQLATTAGRLAEVAGMMAPVAAAALTASNQSKAGVIFGEVGGVISSAAGDLRPPTQ